MFGLVEKLFSGSHSYGVIYIFAALVASILVLIYGSALLFYNIGITIPLPAMALLLLSISISLALIMPKEIVVVPGRVETYLIVAILVFSFMAMVVYQ